MSAGDRGAQRTTVAGRELLLTPTQWRLLETLRSQPGRVFTRAELLPLVMPGTIVLERTIDVHVRALRKKLGPLAGTLRTVRRRGYCFVPPPA
jgi:two-component system phosphate regulon response regulator PhoB